MSSEPLASGAQLDTEVIIVGAGPAGLTAALLLADHGKRAIVLEADPHYVGGISRTASHNGYHFDIGGHRFFSKSKEVEDFWSPGAPERHAPSAPEVAHLLRAQVLQLPAQAGRGAGEAGPRPSPPAACSSFAKARVRPKKNPTNLEDWVTNQFGRRLYEIFFKYYTEKVWGMDCRELSADWAAQRIKSLNLGAAVARGDQAQGPAPQGQAADPHDADRRVPLPAQGPGMLWEECARLVVAGGGEVRMGARMKGIEKREDERGTYYVVVPTPRRRARSR
jgi:protoporphyrinogen oxidase